MKKSSYFFIKSIHLVVMLLFLHLRNKEFQAEFYICCTTLNALQNKKKKFEKKWYLQVETSFTLSSYFVILKGNKKN